MTKATHPRLAPNPLLSRPVESTSGLESKSPIVGEEFPMLAKVPDADRPQHEALVKERADVVNDCKAFLNDACERMGAAYRPGNTGDLAVIALVRHVVEALDGVSLLLASGSVLPCYPLLRGILDAWMGVFFILEKDSDERGAAYLAAQLCQERRSGSGSTPPLPKARLCKTS